MNMALEFQSLLFLAEPETGKLVQGALDKDNLETGKKRKLGKEENEEDDDDDDDDDEEIFSDTDEENAANQKKKLKIDKKVKNFTFKPLKSDKFEAHLEKINKDFKKYRLETFKLFLFRSHESSK